MPYPPDRSQDEVREERQREWPKLLSKEPDNIALSDDVGRRDLPDQK
jgi:hypothetical protein